MNLQGAQAIVTGASSGIGEATATRLAARGAHVVLIARNRVRLEAVAQHIRESGATADVCAGDLADANAIASLARAILENGLLPDILVNCAGAGRWRPILDTPAEEAAAMMAVPYLAAFNVTREFLGGMLSRRRGHIVNVTSVASRLAWPGAVAYTAARWAMEGFTAAAAIVRGIERNQRVVLRPSVFRLLFLMNALFPRRVEATLCRGRRI